jgi:pSer/pThr/pTyr-binding forkhead associated (FHA) protein
MNVEPIRPTGGGDPNDTRPIETVPVNRYILSGQGSIVSGVRQQPRAYLLADDGSILAEVPCVERTTPIILGRGRTADISIDDPYVHRRQAELRWDPETSCHFISHGGGANPTYVNRHRVHLPMRLIGGEHLRVGKTSLIYRIRR